MKTEPQRCPWCGVDPMYTKYHDTEWGVPEYEDQQLFAKLILENAQAGLSWITILRKRDNYYTAFDQFNPEKMARYDAIKVEELMQNSGIVRHKAKILSAIQNAQSYLDIMDTKGSFSEFIWDFVGGMPRMNRWDTVEDIPTQTSDSQKLSQALKSHGFNFVGPTIVYAYMQAVDMVNDHLISCFRRQECQRKK